MRSVAARLRLVDHFCLTNSSVAALTLTALELRQGTVNSNKENIEVGEQAQESIHPVRCFDNVLDDLDCYRPRTALAVAHKLKASGFAGGWLLRDRILHSTSRLLPRPYEQLARQWRLEISRRVTLMRSPRRDMHRPVKNDIVPAPHGSAMCERGEHGDESLRL
jgi:hypothetical protein